MKSPTSGNRSGGKDPEDAKASYETIRIALKGLETIGAIRQEAESNREGTLYRILLPEEIEACTSARAAKTEKLLTKVIDQQRDLDIYNVRENRVKVYERDMYQCRYCSKQLTRFTATLDHVHPIAEGGDHSFENLVTACLACNSRKNVKAVGDFLASH